MAGTFAASIRNYMGEVDDATLLRQAREGNESAFSELYARYQRRIYQYGARMCGSAAADDIVQETFLAVLRAGRFDASRGTVASYLFGIARHHVIRCLERRGPDGREPSNSVDPSVPLVDENPFDILSRQRTVSAVRDAVESLPPLYREVVVLCDLQELDYAMVAEVIDCPIGTVRSRLHRARALLCAKLILDVRECGVGRIHGS